MVLKSCTGETKCDYQKRYYFGFATLLPRLERIGLERIVVRLACARDDHRIDPSRMAKNERVLERSELHGVCLLG